MTLVLIFKNLLYDFPMHEASDNELISSYLSGNEQALESLIQRYLKLIYSFVYRYTGDAASADDLTQEVFVRAWRNLKKFDQEKSFKTWVFAIAKNAALDFLKKKKAIPFSAFDDADGNTAIVDPLSDLAPLSDELAQRADLKDVLANVISRLSPQYRTVLRLRYSDCF